MNNRIVILIELLLTIALFFVYIQPAYSDNIVQLNKQIASTEKAQAEARVYSKKESQLAAQYTQISPADSARLDSLLPTKSYNVHFLYDLNTLASNSGFTLSKFSENSQNVASEQNRNTTGSLLKTSVITLSGTGSYQSFRIFLYGLEHSLRLVDIKSINVSTQNSTNSQNSYTYKIAFKVYWLPDPSSV